MAAPNPLPPSDAIQRLNIRDLPNNLHAAFKTECARRGRTMRGVIIAFLRDAVFIHFYGGCC